MKLAQSLHAKHTLTIKFEVMIMADMDMKQKIKEVRDKFLSNNQIEDIRQNITLGVEERLKFLNAEQIKVVELLEAKHKELDHELQVHTEKVDSNRIALETLLNDQALNLDSKFKDQSIQLGKQIDKIRTESTDIETSLNKTIEETASSQATSLNSKIAKLSDEVAVSKVVAHEIETRIQKKFTESDANLTSLLDANSSKMQLTEENVKRLLEEKESTITKIINNKLSTYEDDKKEFLRENSNKFAETLSKLEVKIESFIQNHQMVEDIIDSRLTEFRNAQKAAFEELEAALTLLERHQDETISRFKNKSKLGINKHINLPTSLSQNRGSILHQSSDDQPEAATIIDNEESQTNQDGKRTSSSSGIKSIALLGFVALIIFLVINYLKLDYKQFLIPMINLFN